MCFLGVRFEVGVKLPPLKLVRIVLVCSNMPGVTAFTVLWLLRRNQLGGGGVKLPPTQIRVNKLKSGIKSCSKVTLILLSNVVCNSSDETNFSHKLLLTNIQLSKILKAFANWSSANITF